MNERSIGLGCAALAAPGIEGERTAHAVVARAWECGIRLFDVAPLYGGGLAEERLGAALEGVPRHKYQLCTKTGASRPYGNAATPPGSTIHRAADVWDFTRNATLFSIKHSLQRLRTDVLDVVHLHDMEGHENQALDGACPTLAELRSQGVVRAIGVGSNNIDTPTRLLPHGILDAVLVAGRLTLLDRSAAPLFAQASAAGVRVIAAGLLNSGVLARGLTPNATFDYRPPDASVTARVQALQRTCTAHGTALMAAALQFVLRNPHVDSVLLGPRSVQELDELLDAISQPIPDDLWETLD